MSVYSDFTGPSELRTRGTVLVVPGRGESLDSYSRFGRRLAADSYRVRVLPPAVVDAADLEGSLRRLADGLSDAVAGIADDDPVAPVVLVASDIGAAAVAALLAQVDPTVTWWPAAVVLAALPGYGGHETSSWDEELDARTHCVVHRGVLSGDTAVQAGSLTDPVPAALLDAAYGGASSSGAVSGGPTGADVARLLLVGDQDPFADIEELRRYAKSLTSVRLTVVHGAHHDVLNDLQHRSVAATVVTFLEALRNSPTLEPIIEVETSTW